jgi:hypothetical protein
MDTAMRSACMVTVAMLFLLIASIAYAEEERAIYINIYGKGPAVDANAFKQVRRVIGTEITKGNPEKFVVYGFGFEGGFGACIELSRFAAEGVIEAILARLSAIQPNPKTTAYSVQAAPECE